MRNNQTFQRAQIPHERHAREGGDAEVGQLGIYI
jgi:hypothetical protein